MSYLARMQYLIAIKDRYLKSKKWNSHLRNDDGQTPRSLTQNPNIQRLLLVRSMNPNLHHRSVITDEEIHCDK